MALGWTASALRRACCPSSAGIASMPSSAIAATSIRRVSVSSSTTSTRFLGRGRLVRIRSLMASSRHRTGEQAVYLERPAGTRPLPFGSIGYLNDKDRGVDRALGGVEMEPDPVGDAVARAER